ncbi:MAG: DsbA family oxidoreductase [Alphaproteobacteria bacterium]|nr:MAG: DsbA family oxidoreductase [Alphaproteobacteria bacterium]
MVQIDIYSDPVCPWCFIGKRRLERTLAARDDIAATLTWRPFQLNPDIPPEGMDRATYLSSKFGGMERAEKFHDAIAEAGHSERIAFDFDAIQHIPNTLDSHRLIRFAGAHGPQAEVVEALFSAHFLEGEDIGDHGVLTRIAHTVGLDGHAVKAYLASSADRPEVAAEGLRARRMSIDAVPCFIIDGQYAISGAQEPEAFYPLLDLANFNKQAAE